MTPPLWQKVKKSLDFLPAKEPLDESEKVGLKLSIQKMKIMAFMANGWGNSVRLYFLGLQNHCRW